MPRLPPVTRAAARGLVGMGGPDHAISSIDLHIDYRKSRQFLADARGRTQIVSACRRATRSPGPDC
jgi:hypothetical protein